MWTGKYGKRGGKDFCPAVGLHRVIIIIGADGLGSLSTEFLMIGIDYAILKRLAGEQVINSG